MTWTPNLSDQRRQAISRAGRAVVRLAIDPEAKEPAHRQNTIVNDAGTFTDREAWDAVAALEHMVTCRGLIDTQPVESDRRAAVDALDRCGQNDPMANGGDDSHAHDQGADTGGRERLEGGPDIEGDPIDHRCERCGAEPGENCRADCSPAPGPHRTGDDHQP